MLMAISLTFEGGFERLLTTLRLLSKRTQQLGAEIEKQSETPKQHCDGNRGSLYASSREVSAKKVNANVEQRQSAEGTCQPAHDRRQ
jgi:hypothetical protein